MKELITCKEPEPLTDKEQRIFLAAIDVMEKENNNFEIGEYIVYVNGDQYELGRVKSLREDGAFVWYHEGETAAKTPYDHMHKLANEYCIKDNNLGGTPIIIQPEIVKCKDCILNGNCRYERGLGKNGFCNQGKRKEDED